PSAAASDAAPRTQAKAAAAMQARLDFRCVRNMLPPLLGETARGAPSGSTGDIALRSRTGLKWPYSGAEKRVKRDGLYSGPGGAAHRRDVLAAVANAYRSIGSFQKIHSIDPEEKRDRRPRRVKTEKGRRSRHGSPAFGGAEGGCATARASGG